MYIYWVFKLITTNFHITQHALFSTKFQVVIGYSWQQINRKSNEFSFAGEITDSKPNKQTNWTQKLKKLAQILQAFCILEIPPNYFISHKINLVSFSFFFCVSIRSHNGFLYRTYTPFAFTFTFTVCHLNDIHITSPTFTVSMPMTQRLTEHFI